MEVMWLILAVFILFGIWVYWQRHSQTSKLGMSQKPLPLLVPKGTSPQPGKPEKYPLPSSRLPSSINENQVFSELQSQLKELAKLGWAQDETSWCSGFVLSSNNLTSEREPAQVIKSLLTHARRVAPEFSVPQMVPRTVIEPTPFAAGRFEVDEEGWVTIKVSPDFFNDRLAAQAILAHEACHYILENSGIRQRDFQLNERYTDLCMFICGFGAPRKIQTPLIRSVFEAIFLKSGMKRKFIIPLSWH